MISALPGPTRCLSPENFFAECNRKTTPATAAISIGKIYSVALKYHFITAKQALKPTNTRLPQKLRALVAARQKIEPPRGVHAPSANFAKPARHPNQPCSCILRSSSLEMRSCVTITSVSLSLSSNCTVTRSELSVSGSIRQV